VEACGNVGAGRMPRKRKTRYAPGFPIRNKTVLSEFMWAISAHLESDGNHWSYFDSRESEANIVDNQSIPRCSL